MPTAAARTGTPYTGSEAAPATSEVSGMGRSPHMGAGFETAIETAQILNYANVPVDEVEIYEI